MALVLGITGGVGTGKSTVLKMLGELGAQTVSADDLAREVVARGTSAYKEIVERFGESVIGQDSEIDRKKLADVVFRDEQERRALESITHPRIIELMKQRIDRFRSSSGPRHAVLAVEIPLLYECGLEEIVDEVLLVAVEQAAQIDRLTIRSDMTYDQAISRIKAQMPLDIKMSRSNRVIWNDGDLESLERLVKSIWSKISLL